MKKMLLLSFLLIPATTHCMQTEIDLSKATQEERQNFAINCLKDNVDSFEIVYYQENHRFIPQYQESLKKLNIHGYSAVGIVAIAIEEDSLATTSTTNLFKNAPYYTKENAKKIMLNNGFSLTKKDKDLWLQIKKE